MTKKNRSPRAIADSLTPMRRGRPQGADLERVALPGLTMALRNRGWNCSRLAAVVGLMPGNRSVSERTLRGYRDEGNTAPLDVAQAIAEALNMSLEELRR